MIKLKIRGKRTLGFATAAVASIFLAIVLSIFAHTENAEQQARKVREAEIKRKQVPITYTPSANIKHFIVFAGNNYRNMNIYLNVTCDSIIRVEQRGKSEDAHDKDEFTTIDLTQAQWRVQDDALILDLSASLTDEYGYGQSLTITLPHRDWEMSLPDNLVGDYHLNNTGAPLNMSVWASNLTIKGHFNRLSLWKLPNGSHPSFSFGNTTVNELHAYANSVVEDDNGNVSISLNVALNAKAIYLHSQPNSRVDVRFLPDLKRLHWQPLQPADIERYVNHQQVIDRAKSKK